MKQTSEEIKQYHFGKNINPIKRLGQEAVAKTYQYLHSIKKETYYNKDGSLKNYTRGV